MSSMTPKEQFRAGFLLRCAEEGCSMADVQDRVKAASTKEAFIAGLGTGVGVAAGQSAIGGAGKVKDLVMDYLKSPVAMLGTGIVGSAALGGGAGHVLGKMHSEEVDPNELKQQELLQAYKTQAARIRQLAALKSPQPAVRSPRLLH
jgi:hypothetical protein